MNDVPLEIEALLTPRNNKVVLVETNSQLIETVNDLAKATGPFALDAERASGFKYSQRAYLIQVMRNGSAIYLIDPIAVLNENERAFEPLAQLLKMDEWILHAATQDLPCLQELGLNPTRIFDTELAGRLLGEPRVGLGALCEQWLKLALAKEHSAVDWSTRPLNPSWLNYAALDVDVLLELRIQSLQKLKDANKLEWALEEFEHLLSFRTKPPREDKWRSMSGLHEIKDQRSLSVAKELWHARETLARKMDVSPGRLIPDAAIVNVSKLQPKSKSALAGEKTFIGRASRTYLDTWWQAITAGLEAVHLPDLKAKIEGIPNHRNWESRHPEAHQRLKTLRPLVVEIAEKEHLPVENLLQPDILRQFCWQPPVEVTSATASQFLVKLGARKWQVKLTAEVLAFALTNLVIQAEPTIG